MALIKAIKKFAKGPEKAIIAESRLGFFRFMGLKGTGFPHPIPANSKSKVPIGSRCAFGFRDSLPMDFAVESPKRCEVKAWEYSCTDNEKTKAPAMRIKRIGLVKRYEINMGVLYQ